MTQRTQSENVMTTIDKIEYWKVSAKFIRYACGRGITIDMWRSHRFSPSKRHFLKILFLMLSAIWLSACFAGWRKKDFVDLHQLLSGFYLLSEIKVCN